MLKTILAGATALAIAGSAIAYAQPSSDRGDRGERSRMSAEDVLAFGDARVAALRTGLKLNAEQEKHWPALEAAMKDAAKQRSERFAARASADRPNDMIERLAARGEAMESRGAALKKLADAASPLYQSLDEGQKKRFTVLARLGGRDGSHMRGKRGNKHEGKRDHRGPRGPERGPRPQ